MPLEVVAVAVIFLGFSLAEFLSTGFFHKARQRREDAIVEFASTVLLFAVTQPAVLLSANVIASEMIPNYAGALIAWPVLAQVGLLLIFDDLMQYWWHRLSHNTKWLYNLHRPHHDAQYMSIRIVYRNNFFYYLMMPSLWFSGVLIYAGLGKVYIFYILVKLLVICAAHSDVQWDRPLYKHASLSPIMWVVERLISTPATHSAHHGKYRDDGISNYKGNFGNLLFFWDVLFGTAKITRKYPAKYGVENLPPVGAAQQLFWPLIRNAKQHNDTHT